MDEATQSMMLYDAKKKSTGVAYLLWFFFGLFGGHRFYARKTATAIVLLVLSLIGIATAVLIVGYFFLAIAGIWALVDAFLIPSMIRQFNIELAMRYGQT